MLADWGDAERKLTDRVSVLVGTSQGRYPSGNSLLVRGDSESVVIDPSIDVVERGGVPIPIDAVLNSHSHEDHMPGNGFFADARGFADGDVFDLGSVRVEAVHLPGHTRGHSGFRISEEVFFLSDIDLTGFGPYYGDAWSDLDDFEESLRRVRHEEAAYYVTFHQKGVIDGRETFLEMLDGFAAVIERRHAAMLTFLSEPRSLEELVEHRFIYRPHVDLPMVVDVETRSAELHLARMLERREVALVEPTRYRAT